METYFELDETQEPLVFYLPTLTLLQETEFPSEVLGLYSFYYAKAKWEQQRTIKETDILACEVLKWNKPHLRKIKKILYDLHLIEDVDGCNYVHLFPY